MFKVLPNGLLQYILHTCPKLWCNPFSKVLYGVDCVGTYFTRVQSCDVTRVQSAAQSNILRTCPKLWCNPCSKWYGMDCFGTYLTHVQSCDVTWFKVVRNGLLRHIPHTCPKLWCNPCWNYVLRSGLLRYILHTCPKLWCNPCSKCYAVDCFGTYFTHVQSCDVTRVQSATQWAASVHTSHMCKAMM